MTAQQQVLFTCDCCAATAVLPLFNKPPMDRMRPPEKWTVITLDDNRAQPPEPMHLCPKCSVMLRDFLNAKTKLEEHEVLVDPLVDPARSEPPYTHVKDWPT